MRIAQVAPLHESVPPKAYGGTERVVSYLTEELVRQGHDVTLFASGDSQTSARLQPATDRALRLGGANRDSTACHLVMLEQVYKQADSFDMIHFHVDFLHFPLSRGRRQRHVSTLHGRLDLIDLPELYREYREMPVVSISDAQRQPLPMANWRATVHNGIPETLVSLHERPGDYLAFIGRISPEKGTHYAIEIARRVGLPLKIAAKVDRVDVDYYREVIKPLLRKSDVEYIGEIGDAEKDAFLGNAYAVLFPIDWPEPFGLAVIEAMACGTPVVAFAAGAVSEIIEPGVTGYIVASVEEAVAAVEQVAQLDRRDCRRAFEQRFTAGHMMQGYLKVYRHLAGESVDTPWPQTAKAQSLR